MKRIRKIISVLLSSILLLSFLPTEVLAYTDTELSELVEQAEILMWEDGTSVSRSQIKAAYYQGVDVLSADYSMTEDIETAKETLKTAISSYKKMTDIHRVEIGGFSSWDKNTVDSFADTSGCGVFYSDKVLAPGSDRSIMIATAGSDTAYFSNASKDEIVVGDSVFGVDVYDTDGIRLWIDAEDLSLANSISVSVGTRSNLKSNTFTTPDIPIKKGYITISWDMLYSEADSIGQSPDLSGAMNFFAVSFKGVQPGFIGYVADLHCYSENPDKYKLDEYKEVQVTNITSKGVYKIVDRASGLALQVSPEITETEANEGDSYLPIIPNEMTVSLDKPKQSLYQEWQICIQPDGTYRLVNKATSAFLTYIDAGTGFAVSLSVLNMNNSGQKFRLAKKNSGYTIATNSTKRSYLNCRYEKLSFSSTLSQVWDLYECDYGDWKEVWSDEFEGDEIDRSKWQVYNGKHRGVTEPIYFRDDPNYVRTQDGNLVIRTKIEQYNGYPVVGAYLTTEGKFGVSYGKIEMRAKLPEGKWIWPALWMLGYNGNWPEDGEIDIMELVGGGEEDKKLYGTLHWLEDNSNHFSKGVEFYNTEKLSNEYHTYAAEWENDQLRLYFDGMQYMSLMLNTDAQRWCFGDNPHYLILNTSIRGPGDDKIYNDTASTSEYYIDYIKVSKRSNAVFETEENEKYYSDEFTTLSDSSKGIWYTEGIAVSPKGRYVYMADHNAMIRLFDPRTGELEKTVAMGTVSNATMIKCSPKGKYTAALSRCGEFLIYRDEDLITKSLITVPGTYLEAAAFSPDETLIYIGGKNLVDPVLSGDNGYLFVYSLGAASQVNKIRVDCDIRTIAASDDGKYVAVGMTDGRVVVYATKGYSVVNTLKCEGQVRKIEFLSGTDELFASTEKGEIVRYDVVSNEVRAVMKNPANVSIKQFSISPDKTKIAVATSSNFAMLFDANNGKLISVLSGFGQLTSDIAFSPDGNRIAVSSFDGTIRIYDDCGGLLSVVSAETGNNGKIIHNLAFSMDSKRLFAGVGLNSRVAYTCKVLTETDRTPLIDAIKSIDDINMTEYAKNSVEELISVKENVCKLLRKPYVSDDEIAAAISEINETINNMDRIPGNNDGINGFESWKSEDLSSMSKTKCITTLISNSSALTPNVTQSLSIKPTSTAAWSFFNYVSTEDAVVQNPFGINLDGYLGLKLWTKALSKELPNAKIYIGYTGSEGSFLYSATLPTITTAGAYVEIPFDSFVHESGEETLNLSKLNTIGFSGKSVTSTYYFTELTAYSLPVQMPEVTGIEDGAQYDVSSAEPPAAVWTEGLAYLDGYSYKAGTPITMLGEHLLVVNNKGVKKETRFTVIDNSEVPIISGVKEREIFDLAEGQKAVPSWNVGSAELNGEQYTGTEISAVGEYELVVKNNYQKTIVHFVIVDTTGASSHKYTLGDFDFDGQITVADALAALRIAAKLVPEDEEAIGIGDVDKDGHVTVADALAILRVAAKLVDSL